MNKYDKIDQEKVADIMKRVETSSAQMDEIVDTIITSYVEELDKYVSHIDERLCDKGNPPTDEELDKFCLNLSSLIYFAGSMSERLGIRDDIAKATYKEVYNTTRDNTEKGTVQDKNTLAELAAQQEQLVSVAYTRAYRIVKAKVDSAQELLASIKKVISRRMQDQQLTNMSGGR